MYSGAGPGIVQHHVDDDNDLSLGALWDKWTVNNLVSTVALILVPFVDDICRTVTRIRALLQTMYISPHQFFKTVCSLCVFQPAFAILRSMSPAHVSYFLISPSTSMCVDERSLWECIKGILRTCAEMQRFFPVMCEYCIAKK